LKFENRWNKWKLKALVLKFKVQVLNPLSLFSKTLDILSTSPSSTQERENKSTSIWVRSSLELVIWISLICNNWIFPVQMGSKVVSWASVSPRCPKSVSMRGNGELLELRLLETGFLSHFQNKMSRFWRLAKEKKF
jgi:hypothetical protein